MGYSENLSPVGVACPVDGVAVTLVSAHWGDAVKSWGPGWNAVDPAPMLGWTLSCGHFVEASTTELRHMIEPDAVTTWFAERDSPFVKLS